VLPSVATLAPTAGGSLLEALRALFGIHGR